MPLQLSITVRNAQGDAIETAIGGSPIMRIRTGAVPANCAAADAGTVLATLTLPANWLTDATNGVKTLSGTWSDNSADASGTAGHFRIYDASGAVCHLQGTVTAIGGGGDMTVDSVTFNAGQQFSVVAFSLTVGNA